MSAPVINLGRIGRGEFYVDGTSITCQFASSFTADFEQAAKFTEKYESESFIFTDIDNVKRRINTGFRPRFKLDFETFNTAGENALIRIRNHAENGGIFKVYPDGSRSSYYLCLLEEGTDGENIGGFYLLGKTGISLTFIGIGIVKQRPYVREESFHYCTRGVTYDPDDEISHYAARGVTYNASDIISQYISRGIYSMVIDGYETTYAQVEA